MKSMTTVAATRQDIFKLRKDMLAEFKALREEMHDGFRGVRQEIADSADDVLDQLHDFMGLVDDRFNKLEVKVDSQGQDIASIKQLLS